MVIGSHFDSLHKIQDSMKVSKIEEHIKSRLDSSPLVLSGYYSIDCR